MKEASMTSFDEAQVTMTVNAGLSKAKAPSQLTRVNLNSCAGQAGDTVSHLMVQFSFNKIILINISSFNTYKTLLRRQITTEPKFHMDLLPPGHLVINVVLNNEITF